MSKHNKSYSSAAQTQATEDTMSSGRMRSLKYNLGFFVTLIFAFVLFLTPILPDMKLERLKLSFLESGIFLLLFLIGFGLATGYKKTFRRSELYLPLSVYFAGSFLFYYFSDSKQVAFGELNRAALSVAAYIVASEAVHGRNLKKFILPAMFYGSFLTIIYALLQASGGIWIVIVPKYERVMSTFGNPIFLAVHLVYMIPIAFGRFLNAKSSRTKFQLIVYLFCAFCALYLTKTRASILALFASVIFMAVLDIKGLKNKIIAVGVILLVFSGVVFTTKEIWLRQQAHLLIWRDTISMWLSKPFFGVGQGAFHLNFPAFASNELKNIWPQGQFIVNDAHNEYIQVLAEQGIFGFGILIWLIYAFIVSAKKIMDNSEPEQKVLVGGLVTSAAAILVQNIFSVDMRFVVSQVYLFLSMGLINGMQGENAVYVCKTKKLPYILLMVFTAASFSFPYYGVFLPWKAKTAVEAQPDFFNVKILEAQKTIADLEIMAKKYPNEALVFEKLGWVLAKEKNWSRAIECYTKAAELSPNNSSAFNNLGNIYYLTGSTEKAVNNWKLAAQANPSNLDSRVNLATAYFYAGKLKEASLEINEVLKRDPQNEKAIMILRQMKE